METFTSALKYNQKDGEAKLEILLEVECICSDDDDLLVVFL